MAIHFEVWLVVRKYIVPVSNNKRCKLHIVQFVNISFILDDAFAKKHEGY